VRAHGNCAGVEGKELNSEYSPDNPNNYSKKKESGEKTLFLEGKI